MKVRTILTAALIGTTSLFVTSCAATRTQESAGEYTDDSVITTKVKAALLNEPGLKSFPISVTTFRGTVQLSGFVDNQTQIDKAVSVTRGVEGVKSVKVDLHVKTT